MKIFNKLSSFIHYYIDLLKAYNVYITLSEFKLDRDNKKINVFYKVGKQKLSSHMCIDQFEKKHFDNISNIDRYKVVKYLTLYSVLIKQTNQDFITDFIEEEIRNEFFL